MKKVLTFLLIFLFLLACSSKTAIEDEVKRTIFRYNTLLAKGYSELSMTPLKDVATEMQAEKEYIHMAALGESRIRMVAEQKSIEFMSVEIMDNSRAVAETKEVWDYSHINIDTEKTVLTEKGVVYNLRYELIKKDGKWLVSEVKSIENKESAAGG